MVTEHTEDVMRIAVDQADDPQQELRAIARWLEADPALESLEVKSERRPAEGTMGIGMDFLLGLGPNLAFALLRSLYNYAKTRRGAAQSITIEVNGLPVVVIPPDPNFTHHQLTELAAKIEDALRDDQE